MCIIFFSFYSFNLLFFISRCSNVKFKIFSPFWFINRIITSSSSSFISPAKVRKNERKAQITLVFLSFFRNFCKAKVTLSQKWKEKRVFLLHFTRLFVTLQHGSDRCNIQQHYERPSGSPVQALLLSDGWWTLLYR